eukprot:scaffold95596_cov47-Cyclotella_meneghiniana.AAC.5
MIDNENKIEEMICNNRVRDSNTTLRLICNRLFPSITDVAADRAAKPLCQPITMDPPGGM